MIYFGGVLSVRKLPLKSKLISMYLPNLEELSLRFVLALPKASRMSLDCKRTFLARSISACPDTFVTAAIYLSRMEKMVNQLFCSFLRKGTKTLVKLSIYLCYTLVLFKLPSVLLLN